MRRGGAGDGGRTIDGAVTCLDAIDRDRRPFAKPATGQENDGPAAGRALGWNHRTEGWGWDDISVRGASCRKLAVWIDDLNVDDAGLLAGASGTISVSLRTETDGLATAPKRNLGP